MPLHFVAPLAAATAWGALQDCDEQNESGESPKDERPKPKPPNEELEEKTKIAEHEDGIEIQRRGSVFSSSPESPWGDRSRNFFRNILGDEISGSDNDDNEKKNSDNSANASYMNPPSIKHSTSTFNDASGIHVPSFAANEGPANNIRMVTSFPAMMGPSTNNMQPRVQKSVLLRRGSSQLSSAIGPSESTFSGFVDGDFASGKVRDIPVDGCFVMSFLPNSHSLLAVGAKKTLDFYETTSYSLACRFPREAQVSAVKWLSTEEYQGKKSLGRNLLAVGDLGGTVSLLHVEDEVLEMCGPTVIHTFHVDHQIRAIDLKYISDSKILMVVGDKGGNISFSEYCRDLEPLTNYVAHQIENDRVLSLSLHTNLRIAYLAVSTLGGEAKIFQLQNTKLNPQPLFSHQRKGALRSVVFSPTGDLLALGGYDKTVILVDTRLWRVVRELKLEGTINVLAFDPATRYLAVGTRDKSFVLFDTSTFVPIKTFRSPGWVTSISWGSRNAYKDCVAVRCERSCVSLLDLTPICRTKFEFEDYEGSTECAVSWSQTGRYFARIQGCAVHVSDSFNLFRDTAKFEGDEQLRGVAFCPALGKENILAVVGLDGHMTVLRIRLSVSGASLEVVKALFVEEHLWVVSWSPDGSVLATGGRGKVLHVYSSQTFEYIVEPLKIEGRIWGIDFSQTKVSTTSPKAEINEGNKSSYDWQMAVASGADVAIIFDGDFQPWLQVHRPRTARALRYHPNQPILAIGDGSGCLAIVDYEQEETLKEFVAGSRINTCDVSPKGDFLVVGTDECVFTLYETTTYKAVQTIPVQGFGMAAKFSPNGLFLALGTAEGIYSIVRLGPMLGIDLAPLNLPFGVEELPPWALNEVLFRSGDGPSFIQRHMRKGDQDNLQRVANILHQHPEAIYAFDRKADEGCFDTALLLRKPNLLKLAVMSLVDGNLKLDSDAILTSSIPKKARMALDEIIENYPPELTVDIMREMTFVKVPFSMPIVVKGRDTQERGSDSYMDPWPRKGRLQGESIEKGEPVISRGSVARTPAVLPMPGLGTMKFLSCLLVKAPPTVFDNDAMAVVLRVLWSNHIRKYFFFDLGVFCVFFILWIVLVDQKMKSSGTDSTTFTLGVAIAVLLLNTLFFVKEVIQADYGRRPGYITSMWNIIDLLSIGCVWYYVAVGCFIDGSHLALTPLAVITSLLLTMKLIAYLRGISDTGWLVSVLVHNLHDVRGFLLILLVILVGFTTTFRILFGHIQGSCDLEYDETTGSLGEECEADPFGSYYRAFVSTFQMVVVGEYESSLLYESEYAALAILVFILAVTCVLIVALNALISVLADSYARVQENAAANRRKERAELIVEYMSILPASKRHSIEKRTTYFHALLEADADGDLLFGKDDWQGGLNALRREMEELIQTSSEQNQKSLDQFKAGVESDINNLRKEVVSLLEDMAGDVRNIRRLQARDGITLNGNNVAKAVKAVKSVGRRSQKAIFGEQNK